MKKEARQTKTKLVALHQKIYEEKLQQFNFEETIQEDARMFNACQILLIQPRACLCQRLASAFDMSSKQGRAKREVTCTNGMPWYAKYSNHFGQGF